MVEKNIDDPRKKEPPPANDPSPKKAPVREPPAKAPPVEDPPPPGEPGNRPARTSRTSRDD
jgi:hypothetical protein